MAIVAKRTVMSLYSNAEDIYSHQVRIVLAEKGVNVEIYQIDLDHQNEELLEINPYGSIPTLIDRDLVLYEARIIMEYLDERFPHPPLLPVYPVARAESRKMMHRVETDWYSLMRIILSGSEEAESARQYLKDSFIALEPVFADKPYFLSEEFSLIDCVIAPLMWRFSSLGIEIPKQHIALHQYMNRLFQRDSFQNSLTDAERQLRVA
ncbi:stringent starvation protein SspA [Legionella sp. W05-934-2]|uniref:stringent starvation protein SspA n=1 Tax=Legionella sp. W05-934-2 TaxID=1198649 RepID=UPI0034629660